MGGRPGRGGRGRVRAPAAPPDSSSTAIGNIDYAVVPDSLTAATMNALQDAAQLGRDAGLTVEIGGDALSPQASDTAVLYSLAVDAVILAITFGALAAAGMPLLTTGIGVGLSLFGIIALSKALGLSGTAQQLGLMLGLAVGIDYALFIISRYREERARGREPQEAAGAATGTAGSAVVFAGLTVTRGSSTAGTKGPGSRLGSSEEVLAEERRPYCLGAPTSHTAPE